MQSFFASRLSLLVTMLIALDHAYVYVVYEDFSETIITKNSTYLSVVLRSWYQFDILNTSAMTFVEGLTVSVNNGYLACMKTKSNIDWNTIRIIVGDNDNKDNFVIIISAVIMKMIIMK